MKNIRYFFAFLGVFCFAGCTSQEDVLSSTSVSMDASTAITNYLTAAQKMKPSGKEIVKGDYVIVDYIGRLDDTEVFDTSIESVARAAGLYLTGKDYSQGLSFEVGAGRMIPGFDQGVIGMRVGETKTLLIPADQAYGQRREDLVRTYPLSDFSNADDFEEGMEVYFDGTPAIISRKTSTEITFDLNSKLAGKDLIFDVTVKSVN